MVVCLRVTHQRNVADTSLLALSKADFQVDGVVFNGYFHRVDAEKEVAIVHIQRTNVKVGLTIVQVLVEQLLIINITFLDAQDGIEGFGGVFRIARPSDVAVMVLVAFVYDKVDAQVPIIYTIH